MRINPADLFQKLGITNAEEVAKIINDQLADQSFRNSITRTMNPEVQGEDLLLNAAMGLAGESGEVIDLLKKVKFQGKPLDCEHLIEELGDVRYYLELASIYLNVTMEEIEQKNIEKLQKRYPIGFVKKI